MRRTPEAVPGHVATGRAWSPARIAFLTWSAVLGAVAVVAAVRGELGPWEIVLLALAWFVVATIGVLFPWLEMYGPIVLRGPAGRRSVALSFDDGPNPVTTRRILALLAPTRHRATFFVLGGKARLHPDVVREIHAGGHTIGVHGDRHDWVHSFRMPWTIRGELLRAVRAVEDETGIRPWLFRPPLGHVSLTTTRAARQAGVTIVGWAARGFDGVRRQTPEAVVERLTRRVREGDVVMLHDASERDDYEPASVRALPEILQWLDERGWVSVGVDVLLDASARSRA